MGGEIFENRCGEGLDKEECFGRLAHLAERLVDVEEAIGAIPIPPTLICILFAVMLISAGMHPAFKTCKKTTILTRGLLLTIVF